MANAKHRMQKRVFSLAFRGEHRRKSQTKKVIASLMTVASALVPLVFFSGQPASAYTIGSSFNLSDPNAAGFGVYIDAPQVQNSYVNAYPATSASTQLETFNSAPTSDAGNGLTIGSCPSSIAGGSVSGGCTIYGGAAEPDLGASTTSGDPAFGGNGSQFATANPAGTVIEFSTNQKYLGLWWAAGSPGNQIDFYSQGVLISSITTSNLDTLLGSAPASSTPDGSLLTAIDGNTYQKNYYFGHPRGYTSVPPTATLYGTSYVPSETYSYIHAFANGNTSFDKVILSGSIQNGFEFDNFVTSTASNLQPIGRLVPYNFYAAQRIVRFDKNAADANGTMLPQTGLTSSNLKTRAFSRTGYSFYGWNTEADGTGTWYSDMGHYDFNSDVILYAQWQAASGKPVISGLGVRVDEATHSYSRPDVGHGLAIDWRGQSPLAGDENWFLCSSPHTQPSDYFLSAFPNDCVAYPYPSMPGGAGNVTFPLNLMQSGKYVAYGMWAQNATGTTYALQSAPNPLSLTINGLSSNGNLSRTAFTVSGSPTSTSSGWYRCDNAFINESTMPSGTCVATNSNALSYTPVLADVGKYMIYKVSAEISGTSLTATKIVNGGPAVVMSRFVDLVFGDLAVNLTNSNATAQLTPIPTHPDLSQVDGAWLVCDRAANNYVSGSMSSASQQAMNNLIVGAGCTPIGAMQNATDIPVNSSYFGKYVTYFYMGVQTSDNTQGLFVYRSALVPTPAPSPSATPSSTPSNSQAPVSGGGSAPAQSPTPSSSAVPTAKPTQKPLGSVIPKVELPVLEDVQPKPGGVSPAGVKVQSKYPSGEIEQIEDVVVPPTVIAAPIPTKSQSPEATFSVKSIVDPVGNSAIGATGVDGQAPEKFIALSSPASAKSFTENLSQLFAMLGGLTLAGVASSRVASRRKQTGGVPGNADASRDPFASSKKKWGDKLWVWNLKPATFLDKPSVWFTVKFAKISPLLSKIFNDGSYIRAVFGSLTLIAPITSAAIAIYAVQTSAGLIANTAWTALLILAWIAIFDALAGLVGILTYAISFWIVAQHVDVWQDIRLLLGTALVIIGPSLLMTAFRSIRRQAALGTHQWWERVSDLAIGPFISGWSMSIFVSALPAIAGMTLSAANHVLLFAVIIALSAIVRVLAEEFAAQNFPHRMDKLTPDEISDAPRIQKAISLVVRYFFWVFMAAGVLGNSWQLWVGSAIVLVPQVLSWYEYEVPNSPTIWRLLPTGVPGLAFGLLVTGWTTTVLSYLVISSAHLAKWAFVILPMPLIVFALLASFGRFGETEHEIKPTKRNKFVYRVGGIVMLAITMRLAGIY